MVAGRQGVVMSRCKDYSKEVRILYLYPLFTLGGVAGNGPENCCLSFQESVNDSNRFPC